MRPNRVMNNLEVRRSDDSGSWKARTVTGFGTRRDAIGPAHRSSFTRALAGDPANPVVRDNFRVCGRLTGRTAAFRSDRVRARQTRRRIVKKNERL